MIHVLSFGLGGLLGVLSVRVEFQLCPNKVAFFVGFVDNVPPKTSLYDALDHQRIVSWSHIGSVDCFLGSWLDVEPVRVVNLPQEVNIVKDLFLVLLLEAGFVPHPKHKGIFAARCFPDWDVVFDG